jgi:hypothetical protein
MTVVLQCAPWCTEQERLDLARRATQRLNHDLEAGLLGPRPGDFGRRLLATLQHGSLRAALDHARTHLDDRLLEAGPSTPWSGTDDDEWPDLQAEIDMVLDPTDGSAEEADETDDDAAARFAELVADIGSFGLRLQVVHHMREQLVKLQETAREITPDLPEEDVPIDRWYDAAEGPRVIGLSDLWRNRIQGTATEDDTRAFFAAEQQLTARWEQSRREAATPTLRRIARVADALQHALRNLLGVDERAVRHPVLRTVFTAIDRDTRALAADAGEQAAAARAQIVGGSLVATAS